MLALYNIRGMLTAKISFDSGKKQDTYIFSVNPI